MTPDAKEFCALRQQVLKIDTVAAELVPQKRRAANVLTSRRRILRKFRNTPCEAFDGEVLGLLE
jgi:hypothetical protein